MDDRGIVVATIDWMSSPPEYSVMGATHLYVGEGWERQHGGNVAVVDMSGVKGAIAHELGLEPPRQTLSDALEEATESARANGRAMQPSRDREAWTSPPWPKSSDTATRQPR